MPEPITAQMMLDAFKQDAPGHNPEQRWAHTWGIGVLGHFRASEVARNFCVATHFNGEPMPVTIRLSNGSSVPERHDNWPDTRGMAVKFHYPDGVNHDLLTMTLPVFGAKTREEFMEVSAAFVPTPIEEESWWQKNVVDPLHLRPPLPPPPEGMTERGAAGLAKYAGTHAFARAFVIQGGLQSVPASWARTEYHAVHTFWVTDPEGVRRPVRFNWEPVDGVFPVPADEMAETSSDFLTGEMRSRLARKPSQFTLRMVIGDQGDDLDDPSAIWPVPRRSVNMGMLVIEKMAEDEGVDVEKMSFNPMRIPPGIEPSGDQILHARGEIYQLGCAERKAHGCPMIQRWRDEE